MGHRGRFQRVYSVGAPLESLRRQVAHHRARIAILAVILTTAGAGLVAGGSTGAELSASEEQVSLHSFTGGPQFLASLEHQDTASIDGNERTEAPPAPPPASGPDYAFAWPAEGAITQGMSIAHPTGIDIAAQIGDPIRAVRDGTVTFAGGDVCCVYGYYIVVEHDEGWSSLYAHLSEFRAKEGDKVSQGDVIGLAGNTGRSDGPHLHFELRKFGGVVNPLDYLEPGRYWAPVYIAASAAESAAEPAPEAMPTATPLPEPEPVGVSQSHAIDIAVRWMEGSAGAYAVQRGTCFAIAVGPNWSVACTATQLGCSGDTCDVVVEACVVGSFVEAACTGY